MSKYFWLLLVLLFQYTSYTQTSGILDSITASRCHSAFDSVVHTNPLLTQKYLDTLQLVSIRGNYPRAGFYYNYDLAYYYFTIHRKDLSVRHFKQAYKLAVDLGMTNEAIDSKIWLANHEYIGQNNEEAHKMYSEALESSLDLEYTDGIANAYYGLAKMERDQEKILENLIKIDSLYLARNAISPILANTLVDIGKIYLKSNNPSVAREYFLKGLEISRRTNYVPGKQYLVELLAEMAMEEYNYEEAYSYFETLLDESKGRSDTLFQAHALVNLANVDIRTNQIDRAEHRILTSISLYEDLNDSISLSNANLMLAQIFIKQKNSRRAKVHLDYSTTNAKSLDPENFKIDLLKTKIDYLALTGDYRSAYIGQKELDSLKNDELDRKNLKAFLELEQKYQAQKKEQEIVLLTSKNELAEQQNANQRTILLATIILTAFIGLFFFFLYRNRQKTNAKLKELDHLKSQFFANISHEFRTPLTLISAPIQKRLATADLDDEERADFERLQRNNNRLIALVDQLLDLSKIEAGALKLNVQHGNAMGFVAAIADSFTYTAQQKHLSYVIDIEVNSETAWFDKDALEKIIVNLLSNAIKYTPVEGSIICNASQTSTNLVLEVKNTGQVLSKNQLKKIFNRFYQIDEHQEGTGIGLALVQELVSLYRGQIEVSSQANGWTSFSVALPSTLTAFKQGEINRSELTKEIRNRDTQVVVPKNGHKLISDQELPLLLVVEDNADVRALLKSIFEHEFNVILGENGNEGTKLALEHIPDIVIADNIMPVLNGIELTQRLKNDERTSHIPIILLTAKAGDMNMLEGIESGADDYITKPFNTQILISKVETLIELRRQLQKRYSRELVLKPKEITLSNLDEKFLEKVQLIMEEELLNSNFSVEEFSRAVGMSRMQLHRKLKALSGLSASGFIRSQRLKLAADLLKKSEINVSQIGYAVGFNDHSYFTKCFREQFHCTPSDYAKEFEKYS